MLHLDNEPRHHGRRDRGSGGPLQMARLDLDTGRIVPTTQKRDHEQSHREDPDQDLGKV